MHDDRLPLLAGGGMISISDGARERRGAVHGEEGTVREGMSEISNTRCEVV